MTNPANIYILYGSKIVLRKNILKKNKGDKTMKKVLLTSAAALAVFTVAPVLANSENPASTNQLLQKKYVSERDIAEEANRQVAFHDSEIRTDAERQFKEQGNKSLADAEKALQDFLNSGYSGHDFSEKKAALEANIAAAKVKSNQTFEDIYSTVKNRYVQKLQEQYRATAMAEGKYYNDVNGVEDNKPNNTRVNEDLVNQAGKGWVKTNGKWVFFKEDGAKATGWLKDNGTWYYLNAEGVMQTGWIKDNGTWYYLDGSGAMQKGWKYVGGQWYYLDGSGAMQTGWKYVGSHWYYLSGSGALLVNTTTPDGYTVNGNGELV